MTSACLIGTQPSSGARDNMGALPQAGTGLGEGQGRRLCLKEGGREPKKNVYLLLFGYFLALARDGPSDTGCCSPQQAPGKEAIAPERAPEKQAGALGLHLDGIN